MKKNWKKITAALLTATMLLGTGCGKKEKNGGGCQSHTERGSPLRFFYAPQYAAIELGYFKEEGIDLTLVTGFGADKTMTAVVSGEADIGLGEARLPSMPTPRALPITSSISPSSPSGPETFS